MNIVNGEEFNGARLGYFPGRVARFEIVTEGASRDVEARAGDVPALTYAPDADGLSIVLYETTPSKITYKTWEKFAAFVDHKDLGADVQERHIAAGHPTEGFVETYTRHAKTLIGAGSGAGADQRFGLETEIVVLTNPYDPGYDGMMQVQVFYQGAPRADVQVEVFAKTADGSVTSNRAARTDAQGIATIPTLADTTYLLDAVVLRPAPDGANAAWETLWASLTVHVPSHNQ